MAWADAGGCRIAYEVSGWAEGPTLLLSHSLGTTSAMWAPQLAAFERMFRVLRYDMRGHGHSEAPPGGYTIDRLGRDALAVLDAAGARNAHVCGVSIGGITALWLAIHAPERVGRIVVANSGARIGTAALWDERIAIARRGMESLADAAVGRWFTDRFIATQPAVAASFRGMIATTPVPGYVGCASALRDADLANGVAAITAPTLVVTGLRDAATAPELGRWLVGQISTSRLVELDAAHLSNVEQADRFNEAVIRFLTE